MMTITMMMMMMMIKQRRKDWLTLFFAQSRIHSNPCSHAILGVLIAFLLD